MLDQLIVSIATILLLLGMEVHFKQYLFNWATPMLVAGLLILVLGKKLMKDFESNFLKKILTNSTGIVLIVVGAEYWLEQRVETYWAMFIIVAILLFQYHRAISDKVS